MCATPEMQLIDPDDQSYDQNDGVSICSMNSSVNEPFQISHNFSVQQPVQQYTAAENIVQQNVQPTVQQFKTLHNTEYEEEIEQDARPIKQMTPSANLMANAFTLGNLRKMTQKKFGSSFI